MKSQHQKLIVELRRNARSKLTEISEASKIPVSTLFDSIHNLESENIIEHKTLVNFEKLGFNTRVFMAFKINLKNKEILEDYMKKAKNINSIFHINSGYDYLIDGVFRNQKELQKFIDEIGALITEKNILNVIDVVENERFLTNENHFE